MEGIDGSLETDRSRLSLLPEDRRGALSAFYLSVGYAATLHESDEIVIAALDNTVVGAVRLCEEEGVRVLRGMYVDERRRGHGIGRKLLQSIETRITELELACYCLPFARLEPFYGGAGFVRIDPSAAPNFLVERFHAYAARGSDDFIIMKRD